MHSSYEMPAVVDQCICRLYQSTIWDNIMLAPCPIKEGNKPSAMASLLGGVSDIYRIFESSLIRIQK